jgi:D-glycero-D-manno-heptose 1,7-bisphosphate phosphatase
MSKALRPAVLLDRDGVINRVYYRGGVTNPPAHPGEFEFLPSVIESVAQLKAAGFALAVVTNQPDVARGTQTRARVEVLNDLVRQVSGILDVLTCFHDTADECDCRKPKPGLLLTAAHRFGLDLSRSFMVGDRWSDVEAGRAAGCRTVLIDNPYCCRERCQPDYCAADLPAATQWILRQVQGGCG